MTPPQQSLARQYLYEFCFVLLFILVAGIKLYLAQKLELYSDEIFYWQASQFPALAYSDLPFMSALLAGSGAGWLGHTPIAVRALFLLMGSAIPLLIYWLARPLTGQQQALNSALLSLCLPPVAFLGLLAVPDVPMIFFGLFFLGCLERATRLHRKRYWLLAGVAAALGMSSHYRFALWILSGFVFLLAFRNQWPHWRRPVLWFSLLIAAAGLYPAISFNLGNDLSGLDYHLLERHPWQFQTEGLAHPFVQAVIITPLLYILCWICWWQLLSGARRGDDRRGLFVCFASVNLGLFLILAPWSDTTRTTLHWPLSGYLPLLVWLPPAMRTLRQQGGVITSGWLKAAPILGFAGTLMLFIGIGSQGFNQQLQTWLGTGVLSNKMAGWQPLVKHLQELRANGTLQDDMVVVTDNYYTSAQIAFALNEQALFTIDEDKTVRDGRQAQYAIWQRNTQALQESHAGHPALFITEDSTLDINEKMALMKRACHIFNGLAVADQLFLYQGDKRFSFYTSSGVLPEDASGDSQADCPLPGMVWLEQPLWDTEISSIYPIIGWAYAANSGVRNIRIRIDNNIVTETTRQVPREDVAQLTDGHLDPGAPMLGFSVDIDTRQWRNGRHTLSLELELGNGERQLAAQRYIYIRN